MTPIVATSRFGLRPHGTLAAAAVALIVLVVATKSAPQAASIVPHTLSESGLYADADTLTVDAAHLAFAPQYPLWTDGAAKRRWLSLPPGSAIDASDPDAWVFPAGTRLWKEFAFAGQRVETRMMERQQDGAWRYAAYAWSADGRDAQLVPERGRRGAYPLGGGKSHTIPGVNDCKACHQGGRSEVLGFGLIQLAPELDGLIARGVLAGLPPSARAARWTAASETERAAVGYLHGNCGHCHNETGALSNLGLSLRQPAGAPSRVAIASTFAQAVKKPAPGLPADAVLRIEPRHPERSALIARIVSRYPPLQMPPLGTELVDREAVALLQRWIAESEFVSPFTQAPEKGPTQ